MNLDQLNKQLSACSRCSLRESASAPVPGIGAVGAHYMLIGEAPGKNEDKEGVPFVGAAGRRLNKLLALAGIDINDCYLTNTCKCLPPKVKGKQTAPKKAERLACYPWLKQEVQIVRPKVVIPLGATPLTLFTDLGITGLHGTQFTYTFELDGEQLPVYITPMYHPALALHKPRAWAVMLNDWEHKPDQVPHDFTVVDSNRKYPDLVALDTENDANGKLGAWSVAFRDETGKLCVASFTGSKPHIQFGGQVIMHNAKWDLRVLDRASMKRPPPQNIHDTMLGAYCLGYGRQESKDTGKSGDKMVGGLGLKYLARRHLGMEMKTWEQVKNAPEEDIREYNAADSVATYLLWEKWRDLLPEHYWKIDQPLLDVCMAMEDRGITVDPSFLTRYGEFLAQQIQELGVALPLNPFSPDQIAKYVYGTLGVTPTRFTDTGKPSTDKELLETIDDPVVRQILKYKEYHKEKGTYVDNYVAALDVNNRLHCEFKQTSTATGRLSSANPNLQNVSEDKEDRPSQLKELFIAPPNMVLVRADYKQLELRVFAALAGEERMIEAFQKGHDPHQETGDFLGIPRHEGRNVNFLMLYGGTAWKISNDFHVPIDRAKEMIQKYYAAYPAIAQYHQRQIEKAHNDKYITNWFGRKRRLDAMFSDDWRTVKEGEREAINTDVQGTAADLVKQAMVNLHYQHHAPLLLQVHDELVFEIPKVKSKDYARWLYEFLPTLTIINGVSFPVDVGIGGSWAEAKKEELCG